MKLRHALWVAMLAVTVQGCSKNPGDPCPEDPCSGHGSCVSTADGRAVCECEPGYRSVGLTCVADCFAVDCSNLGGCLVQDNEPVCVCDQGYQGVGLECRPAPRTCHGVDCSGYGVCVDLEGKPACICETRYVPFSLSCVPARCTNVLCSGHGACLIQDGAPSCQCDLGFVAVGLSCQPSDCSLTDCSGHGACLGGQGEAHCQCDQGYVAVGLECRPAPCEQEDCSGHGACVEGSSGLECVCDPGYAAVGLSCRPRCSNIDCGGHGACIQDEGEVSCLCDPGFVAQGQSCVPPGSPFDGGPDGGVPNDGGSAADTGVDASKPTLLDWVPIAGGTFQMGSNSGNAQEQPVHSVTVPSFEITRTEVTVEQYGECVAAGSCTEPWTGTEANWNAPGYENHPVNHVEWQQSVDFCTWAGGRLPSEAEWEYAARSRGQDITYPWGDATATCAYAVMLDGMYWGCGTDRTWAVCSKPAGNTAQGLCDMAGNTWEWVQDWYHSSYTGAPTDGSAWVDSGSDRVLRGGSMDNTADALRAANRAAQPAAWSSRWSFRCARAAR